MSKLERKKAVHKYGTVNNTMKDNLQYSVDNIYQIKNYEYFYASDSRLVECIRRIEECDFIKYLQIIIFKFHKLKKRLRNASKKQ